MKLSNFFAYSIWNTSFRPFFLFGSVYAFVVIGLWLLLLFDITSFRFKVNAIHWHSYEMVYGFARGIILGFLFTAAQNWTGKTIAKGSTLFTLFIFWLLGRFAFFPIGNIAYISFGFDLACSFLALILITPHLFNQTQIHNKIIVYHLGLIPIFQLFSAIGIYNSDFSDMALHFIHLGLFQVILIITLIAGRILPFFTGVVVPNYNFKKNETLESILSHTGFIFLFLELFTYWEKDIKLLSALISFSLGVLHSYRLYSWKPWLSVKIPILNILYLGYIWIALGFFMYSAAKFSIIPESIVYHAFGIGAIGIFIFGMITRVSLGHTGRKIIASKTMIFSYTFINLAVIIRVVFPIMNEYKLAYAIAGTFWCAAFALFFIQYMPYLLKARPDGKNT